MICYVSDSDGLRPYVCPLTLPLSRLGLLTHSEATVVLEVSDGKTFCKHICFLQLRANVMQLDFVGLEP